MWGYRNAWIYIEGQGLIKSNMQIDNGKIVSFADHQDLKEISDDYVIIPGFIDEHVHGANGSDAMDEDKTAITNIAFSVAQDGVTSFLATTMTMEQARIEKALKNIDRYMKSEQKSAKVIGVHLEGPFISKKYCGAQDPHYIVKPSVTILEKYRSLADIKMVTFAVEEADNEFLEYLLQNDICPSLGHSDASAQEAAFAFSHNVDCITHTYNAMRGIHHRDIGVVGEAFLNDDVYCEVICDLHHVSKEALQLLYKMKGPHKIILITDSMEARFLEDGKYSLGGQEVYVANGMATLKNGVLAGSVLKMNEAIKNIYETLEIDFTTAIDMATINPARHLKIDDKVGSLKIGKDADFVIMKKDFTIIATYSKGQLIYQKGE